MHIIINIFILGYRFVCQKQLFHLALVHATIDISLVDSDIIHIHATVDIV